MDRYVAAGCDAFTRALMFDVSPQEIGFIPDYKAAIEAKSGSSRTGGLEFGIEDAMIALGPLVVFAGQKVFSDLGDWAISGAEKVIKRYISEGAQRFLPGFLRDPKKGSLRDILTDEGKEEIIAILRSSFKGKNIPKEQTEKVLVAVKRQLFSPEHVRSSRRKRKAFHSAAGELSALLVDFQHLRCYIDYVLRHND